MLEDGNFVKHVVINLKTAYDTNGNEMKAKVC